MAYRITRAQVEADADLTDIAALEPTDGDLLRWDSDGTRYSGIQPSAVSVTSTGGTSKTLAAWTDDILDVTADSGIVYAADYITVGSTSDQSTAMQNALTAATGGKLILPEATIFCKELSIPPDTDIEGVSEDKSILKLPNTSNTFVLASQGYITNSATVDLGGRYSNFMVDGNKSNQSTNKPAMIMRSYRGHCSGLTVQNSKGRGLLLTALSANSTVVSNGMAENEFDSCAFQLNDEEGWYGEDGASNQLADWTVSHCIFYGNGGTTKFNCYAERSAGAKFLTNQMYSGGIGEAYFDKAGRMVISGNHVDITTAGATTGNVYGMRVLLAGQATVTITGNIFHNSIAAAGSVTWQHLSVSSAEADAIASIAGNTFYSESFTHTAWAHTGSGFSCDDANTYYQSTQPSPSSTVRRGLQSNATGTWTLAQALATSADITQSLAGGAFIQNALTGEGTTQRTVARYAADTLGPIDNVIKGRGTIASPAGVNQFDEGGRRGYYMYASGGTQEVARERVVMQEASPSSTALAVAWVWSLCPDGSATITEAMRLRYSVGLQLYGSTVVDAGLGVRLPSFTSTALNAIGNAVNTANKVAGKMVWNSTVSKPVWAVGATAAGVWVDGAGTTINTPV